MGKPGDWICISCGELVFSRNARCKMCGASKPEGAGRVGARDERDWNCPNCGDLVFGSKKQCRMCGASKPHQAKNDASSSQGRTHQELVNRVKIFQKASSAQNEDWYTFCGVDKDPNRHSAARLEEFCQLHDV